MGPLLLSNNSSKRVLEYTFFGETEGKGNKTERDPTFEPCNSETEVMGNRKIVFGEIEGP